MNLSDLEIDGIKKLLEAVREHFGSVENESGPIKIEYRDENTYI